MIEMKKAPFEELFSFGVFVWVFQEEDPYYSIDADASSKLSWRASGVSFVRFE